MIRKPLEKEQAIKLRKLGYSIKEIAALLHLSSSTVSLWVRNIELSTEQKERLVKKVFDTLQKGRIKAEKVQKELRTELKKKLITEALSKLGKVSKRDLFILGIGLYWAEGFKKDSRLGFANSDPKMIKLFLEWLYINGVPKSDISLRLGLNISHKYRTKIAEKYWSDLTNIPLDQFQRTFYQKFKWKKVFPNPEEYFGVIRVRAYNQGSLFIKIHAWLESIKQN